MFPIVLNSLAGDPRLIMSNFSSGSWSQDQMRQRLDRHRMSNPERRPLRSSPHLTLGDLHPHQGITPASLSAVNGSSHQASSSLRAEEKRGE